MFDKHVSGANAYVPLASYPMVFLALKRTRRRHSFPLLKGSFLALPCSASCVNSPSPKWELHLPPFAGSRWAIPRSPCAQSYRVPKWGCRRKRTVVTQVVQMEKAFCVLPPMGLQMLERFMGGAQAAPRVMEAGNVFEQVQLVSQRAVLPVHPRLFIPFPNVASTFGPIRRSMIRVIAQRDIWNLQTLPMRLHFPSLVIM